MKKEIFYLTMMFLLFFTISYTYSTFKNTIIGNINANINNWVFKANVTNGILYNDGYKLKLNGSSGFININLNTIGGNKAVDYSIELIGDNSIKYYEDSNYTKLINNNIYNSTISSNTSNTTTIYYKCDKSLNIDIIIKIKANHHIFVYGVKRNTNSTSTAWERINDSVSLVANAVKPDNTNPKNDFDSIYPWSDIKSYNYNASTKEITAWFGDANFKFDGTNGEVLTYIPGFYYKREVIDDIEYQYISKENQKGFSYSESFSVGRYKISGGKDAYNGSGLSSGNATDFIAKSKSGVYPSASSTITIFRKSARNLGDEFSLMDYHFFIIQLLYLVEYADYDSQTLLGKGNTNNAYNGAVIMGGTNDIGMKSGCILDDEKHSMIYRGIEDIYGNALEFIDGINIKNYQLYINYDYTTYISNIFSGKYQPLSYVNSSDDGYITKIGYDSNNPLIGIPTKVNSNNVGSIKDYNFTSKNDSTTLRIGGNFSDSFGFRAGLWCTLIGLSYDKVDDGTSSRLIRHH